MVDFDKSLGSGKKTAVRFELYWRDRWLLGSSILPGFALFLNSVKSGTFWVWRMGRRIHEVIVQFMHYKYLFLLYGRENAWTVHFIFPSIFNILLHHSFPYIGHNAMQPWKT